MIIKLSNHLFKDPIEVYSEYKITKEEWTNIIYKYKFLEYKQTELQEYINVILKKDMPYHTMCRLLIRYELYTLSQALISNNIDEIHIQHFHPHEKFIQQYHD